ncbi:Mannitol 1-phosphate dehydrogenase [Lasiodiplodia theobromae]|uniref:Mannitol 1-phosphate dehydrogenase n=1 Tax=Lasiodiplodia theobromae TaxID=45133 RepID=UPI0015C2F0F7|nr:Mannitol 1-phosphate dehydrogenase [Lasiodiplodia theobromae]KAF4536986.1 Mannitol 1-phosphate dehydrogenase [Lasiodiplodia theobromae]
MSTERNFNIAVVGGGIAGVTLTIGLVRQNIPVTLYESAQAFGEIGAGVAIGANAARAMSLIAPEVRSGFEKVATFNLWDSKKHIWFDFRRGMGHGGSDANANQGELISSVPGPSGQAAVHRAHFLDAMVDLVPDNVAKFGKRLDRIETLPDGNVKLHFLDGTEAVHSAVIGCDGIKSRTRQILLGDDHPAAKARFSGKYAYRGLIPMEKAAELLGDELARNSQMYLGYHGHVLTFPIEHGATMNVVAFASSKIWDEPNWVVPTTKEALLNDFAGWSKHVRDIMSLMQKTDIWALFEHPPAPYYTRDRICVIGDAAHATTPHQGSGAGMAVEDAWLMAALLADVKDAKDVQAAFNAFEKVRIDRTHRLVTTSNEAGRLYDFELPGCEDDVKKIAANLQSRMSWIWEEDLERELVDARKVFNEEVSKASL